ncbi:hypothetical protein PoB_002792700 [Plakobranchus ocellatus]|uniref:Uncharacterized protein n=1 Tax=Plakobranchus ocellatus TaxID=259542 RepID=A0AAV4A3I5_9GAST|nr:hypothetical protein PoB_002792700 [Plakobranchus ocellatus]
MSTVTQRRTHERNPDTSTPLPSSLATQLDLSLSPLAAKSLSPSTLSSASLTSPAAAATAAALRVGSKSALTESVPDRSGTALEIPAGLSSVSSSPPSSSPPSAKRDGKRSSPRLGLQSSSKKPLTTDAGDSVSGEGRNVRPGSKENGVASTTNRPAAAAAGSRAVAAGVGASLVIPQPYLHYVQLQQQLLQQQQQHQQMVSALAQQQVSFVAFSTLTSRRSLLAPIQ